MFDPPDLLFAALATWSVAGGVRVHTTQDSIASLPPSFDKLIHIGDVDGDGGPDIVQRTWVDFRSRFDVVSVRDVRLVRVLWDPGPRWTWRNSPAWDAGEDLDGDGSADLVVGFPEREIGPDGAGAVLFVSGASGEERFLALGHGARRGLGASVAMAGDLDGDGLCDVVVGAVPRAPFGDDAGRGLVGALRGSDGGWLWELSGRRKMQKFGGSLAVIGDLDCDGVVEIAAKGGPDPREKAQVICGARGARVAELAYDNAGVVRAGDVDGDGTPDLVFERDWDDSMLSGLYANVVSGATLRSAGDVRLAGLWPDWGSVFALGDLDGDGFDDLGTTASDYAAGADLVAAVAAGKLDLRDVELEALRNGEGDSVEVDDKEGCVWVYSGRTRELIWVLLGRPGLREELGRGLCSVPDVSGDGWPDLVVSGREATYVFAGPGR